MEQALPFDLGEMQSTRWKASSQSTVRLWGYPTVPAFKEACSKGLLDDKFLKKYLNGNGVQDSVNQYGGYQSFVSTKRPRPAWNNLTNFKQWGFSYPWAALSHRHNNLATLYFLEGREHRASIAQSFRDVSYLRAITPKDTLLSSNRAWQTMQPRFESDVDLLMSLGESLELVQLSSLLKFHGPKSISNSIDQISSALNLPKLLKTAPKIALSGLTQSAAESWLAIQLAIMPTLSDAHNILNAMSVNIDQAQQNFAQKGIDGNTRNYRETLYEYDTRVPGTYNAAYKSSGTRETVTFNAAMHYGYQYSLRDHVKAYEKYLGLHSKLSTYWEWIPFSFVVDYFLKIGKALKAMERDPNVSNLNVFNYSESLLSKSQTGSWIDSAHNLVSRAIVNGRIQEEPGLTQVAGSTSSLYTRVVTEPSKGLYVPRVALPSSKQSSICLALVRVLI